MQMYKTKITCTLPHKEGIYILEKDIFIQEQAWEKRQANRELSVVETQWISSAGGDFKQGYPPWTEISKAVISSNLIFWVLCFSTILKPTCHLEQNWEYRFLEEKKSIL